MGTGNFCRFSYRKMKEYGMSRLHGGAAVLPKDGAEQAEFLAHGGHGGVPRASIAH